jgi:predicted nucleic acid-binding protein
LIAVVDTSIWLSAFLVDEPHHHKAVQFVDGVLAGQHRALAPATVYVEIAAALSRRYRGFGQGIAPVDSLLAVIRKNPHVRWQTLDLEFASDAASVGASHAMKGMDAIVVTTALYFDLPLLTEDRDFERAADVVTVLSLKDV